MVLGLYCILTVVIAWSLVSQMTTHLAGDDVDVWINPWADWWTNKALTEGLDFYHTDYMFYPQGVSLVFHSFSHVNTAISLLLTPLIGHFAAYNFTILLALALSGFGMYLLVNHLVDCRPAAFIAGFVFAFHPYHVFQSAHPVLFTTQFIPLFVLALDRLLHDAGAGWGKWVFLAALWFLLTALSSWHLMILLAGWTALYLLYAFFLEQAHWPPGVYRRLILLVILIALTVTPFLWPILREQLTSDTAYMAVDVEEGRGNDLLSFFVPNRQHPVLGPPVLELHARIGHSRNSPAYLGYVAVGLAVLGMATGGRKTRFWWWAGVAFVLLSLGAQVKWLGKPLHTFHLPWAIPITGVLRHPSRASTCCSFSRWRSWSVLVVAGCIVG
jgi:hypothetical protein